MTKQSKDDVTTETEAPRGRTGRKKVYERVRETQIPDKIQEMFRKNNYELRSVRWALNGVEDYRSLYRREQEGYEFVKADELPEWYLKQIRIEDTRARNGLVTIGDLCLMKIDIDLRNSRRDYYNDQADAEVKAVNINVLEKKGFKNLGTRSKTMLREPTFSD